MFYPAIVAGADVGFIVWEKGLVIMKSIVLIVSALFWSATAVFSAGPATTSGDWRFSFAFAPNYYDTSGVESKSIPVNPADAGFLHGNTEARARSGVDWACFELGLAKSFRIRSWEGQRWSLRPIVGINAQFSFLSLGSDSSDNTDRALFNVKQQSSDTRPPSSGSFVYDKLNPGIVTPIPFLGVEINCGNLILSPEIGFACKQFSREFGDYRWAVFSAIGKSSEWVFSPRPALKIGYKFDENIEVGVSCAYESYKCSFGTVKEFSAGIYGRISF